MICAQQITANTVCAWWAKMISAKTHWQGGLPSADPKMKQNQAPTQALAALALFRTNRQAFGLALIWPGCRSYAVDYFWICESSEVSTPTPWQLGSMQPSRQPRFRSPNRLGFKMGQQSLKLGPASGPGTFPVRLQCHFLRLRRVELVMGCCTREEAHRLDALSLLTPRRCRCGIPRFACHPKPIPWSFLALDRPAHKGCSGPSSWADA